MATKTIQETLGLDLYFGSEDSLENVVTILGRTLTIEEIYTESTISPKHTYHIEPLGVTLVIAPYLCNKSYIKIYGSDEKIAELEHILVSALREMKRITDAHPYNQTNS